MIERICPKCRVPMNGDKCIKPNCGCATKMSSTIYWCDDCNVPIFENICPSCGNKGRYIATDMRPVFPEENVLISLILGDNPQKYQESSVWFGSGMYIIDGKKVRLSITKLNSLPLDKIHKLKEKYEAFVTKINYCFFDEYIRKFIKANADRYNFITEEAVQFVQKYREKYAIEDMMVSFSGGKDSTVTSHIVNRALGTNKVLHIFGDTTLEFPYTLEYKKRFKKNEESRGVRVLTAKNREKNFEDLCDIVGPPSRVMRWCCTVFKTGAIQKTISSAFKDKNNILSFQGIRHSESVSRSKYERESESPKISKQTVASPIIDWIDYDVWLYILTTGIDFNEAYRLGWTRVGCWCCPNNGGWSEFLAKRSKMGLYDGRMTNFMSCLEGMDVYSDQDVASKVVKAVTDVYMENWNTGSLEEFVEALTSVKNEVESIRDDSVSGELELKFIGRNGETIKKLYSYADENTGSILRNVIEDTLDEYDDLSVNDRVSILLEMIEKIIK